MLTYPKHDWVQLLEVTKLKIPHFQGGERGGMFNQDVSTHTLLRVTEQLVPHRARKCLSIAKAEWFEWRLHCSSCGFLRSPDSAFTQTHWQASVFPEWTFNFVFPSQKAFVMYIYDAVIIKVTEGDSFGHVAAWQGHTSSEARWLGPNSSRHLGKISSTIADNEMPHFFVVPDNRHKISPTWLH